MTSRARIAGAWTGGIAATLLLAAPAAVWLLVVLVLAFAMVTAKA